jgi:hypothetical protein
LFVCFISIVDFLVSLINLVAIEVLGDLVLVLTVVLVAVVGLFRRVTDFAWVVVDGEVLRLPVGSHKSSSLFEVRGEVQLLFAPLNFRFHTTSSFTPLVEHHTSLFVSALLLKLAILVLPPNGLELALLSVILGWNVGQVTRLAMEFILSGLRGLLLLSNQLIESSFILQVFLFDALARGVECLEWVSSDTALLLHEVDVTGSDRSAWSSALRII